MENTKYTPGPWQVVNLALAIESEDRWIATCDSHHANDEENDLANARLIAAAPDLLAALKDMTDIAYLVTHVGEPTNIIEVTQAINEAREAIKKATEIK